MSSNKHYKSRDMLKGLLFISPNLIGVMIFVIVPVVFSLTMAFTDWDLKLHNQFNEKNPSFVGFDNFVTLFTEGRFFRYLGNTLYFMMGIPVSIAGSLLVALMLSDEPKSAKGRRRVFLLAGAGVVFSAILLVMAGLQGTAMTILLVGVAGCVMMGGMAGGTTVYRTIFYTPHFVAGVATFILWKKLYDPQVGPINAALRPILDSLAYVVESVPAPLFQVLMGLVLLSTMLMAWWLWSKLRRDYLDGEIGTLSIAFSALLPCIPVTVVLSYGNWGPWLWVLIGLGVLFVAIEISRFLKAESHFKTTAFNGFGGAFMLAAGVLTGMFILFGLSAIIGNLPAWVAGSAPTDSAGLEPPDWLNQYAWAKPALMIMGFWAAIGSNNMLLYLAALSGVPPQLHEAASIDGASRFAKFWHVTWPQLAPTTFFIVVMATIYGLQGGFEMAHTMTRGGPAGSTTTLSYFIYTEGFETGRFGFTSAVAWALFVLVFGITLFNWTFGNRYVND